MSYADPAARPSSTAVSIAMEAKHAAVYPHLVRHGLICDPSLLAMVDLRGVTHDEKTGAVTIPTNFATALKASKPHLFVEHRAAFDARTAKSEDVEARLAELTRGAFSNRAASENACVLAELRAGR